MTRIFIVSLLFFLVSSALGHDGMPVYLEFNEISDSEYELAWRIPSSVQSTNLPTVSLEGDCDEQKTLPATTRYRGKRIYECVDREVSLQISLSFPRTNPSLSTIVLVERSGFRSEFLYASPGVQAIEIPSSINEKSLLTEYSKLGLEHILRGYDHLLFVLCVVWLAFTFNRILLAVTGFTIAHSVTLGLAAMEVFALEIEPTEALIALSIVFVAAELARQNRASLSWRYPVVVSSVFGLLHGFGFASVLEEIGLPTNDMLMALFAFNLGVEVGQLLFVLVLVLLAFSVHRASGGKFDLTATSSQRLGGYTVGIFATVWFFERLATFG